DEEHAMLVDKIDPGACSQNRIRRLPIADIVFGIGRPLHVRVVIRVSLQAMLVGIAKQLNSFKFTLFLLGRRDCDQKWASGSRCKSGESSAKTQSQSSTHKESICKPLGN